MKFEYKAVKFEIHLNCSIIFLDKIDETIAEYYRLKFYDGFTKFYIMEFSTTTSLHSVKLLILKFIDEIAQQYQDGSKYRESEEEFRSLQDPC